jgi:LmbE family N-acetylglucosaminyl deacetylase
LVAQATSNREMVLEFTTRAAEDGTLDELVAAGEHDRAAVPSLPPDFGTPVAEITHVVDATPVIQRKRSSMLAHASQIGADHFMAAMPDEIFELAFGTEWFVIGRDDGSTAHGETLLGGLLRPNPQHRTPS